MKLVIALTVLAISCAKCLSEDFKILILHNSDMQSRFEETCNEETKECYGGFARTAHVIRQARKEAEDGNGPPVIYLNSGNTYAGTLWFNVHQWNIVAELLNLLKPDAITFGSHEFDLKVTGAAELAKRVEFPIVAANLDLSQEPELQRANVSKSVVLTVGGQKVGVIGYVSPETAHSSSPGKIIFEDEVAAVKRESDKLDKSGVKIIIAVGHSRFEVDKKIAREVPLVDVVVGGYTNPILKNAEEIPFDNSLSFVERNDKKVPVVQAYPHTKYMGHLIVVFNSEGEVISFQEQPILLTKDVHQEEDVLNLLEQFRPRVKDEENEIVGISKVTLDGDKISCRTKECNLGNLICDSFVTYVAENVKSDFWSDAPIAIINGGAIRATVKPDKDGKITRADLLNILPFGNDVYVMSLKGSDLKQTLEIGASNNGETERGEFIQTSGIQYKVNFEFPSGERVENVTVRCRDCDVPSYEPLEDDKVYRIVTTSYLIDGGDKHVAIKDNAFEKTKLNIKDVDVLVWYVKKLSPIYPEEDERVVQFKENGASNLHVATLLVAAWAIFNLLAGS